MLHDRVYLRKILAEPVPVGGTDADTLFTNTELDDMLARFPSINYAAAVGWSIKAGKLSDLIPIEESGSKRGLNVKFNNAQKMAEFYTKLSGADQAAIAAAVKVAGIAVNPYKSQLTAPLTVASVVAKQAGGMWIAYEPAFEGTITTPALASGGSSSADVPVEEYVIEMERGRTYRLMVEYKPDGVSPDLTGWTFLFAIKNDLSDADYAWSGTDADGSLTVDTVAGTVDIAIPGDVSAAWDFTEGEYEMVGTSPVGDSVRILNGPLYVNVGVVA